MTIINYESTYCQRLEGGGIGATDVLMLGFGMANRTLNDGLGTRVVTQVHRAFLSQVLSRTGGGEQSGLKPHIPGSMGQAEDVFGCTILRVGFAYQLVT